MPLSWYLVLDLGSLPWLLLSAQPAQRTCMTLGQCELVGQDIPGIGHKQCGLSSFWQTLAYRVVSVPKACMMFVDRP